MNNTLSNGSATDSHSNYRVLALETRPQTLSALVGQETVQKVLHDLISKARIPHALLFTGTRGTGKTSTARIFAKALCCEQGPTSEPCGKCAHCQGITASSHEDVLEIDGASNTGVEQIRELRESARFFPKSARYKIFIIDEVHMLSIGAFNALLKTLEEPPPKVVFVLATTEVTKVPTTVRSRCMVLPFKRVEVGVLADHFEKVLRGRNITAEKEALLSVAREARGSFRDGLSLLEQAIPFALDGILSKQSLDEAFGIQDRDYAQSLFRSILLSDTKQGLSLLHEADRTGLDFARILHQTAEFFRHAIVLKALQAPSPQTGSQQGSAQNFQSALSAAALVEELLESERSEVIELTKTFSTAALTECFRTLQQGIQDLSRATSQKPWAELAFLQCVEHAKWLDTESLLRILGNSSSPQATQHKAPPERVQTDVLPQAHDMRHGAQYEDIGNPLVANKPRTITPQPQPSSRSHSDANQHATHLNFVKLKEWIAQVSERSVPLGAKLRHAHFETFNETEVKLALRAENKIYGSVSSADMETMRRALEHIGFARAKLQGFHVEGNDAPSSSQASGQAGVAPDALQKKKNLPNIGKDSLAQTAEAPALRKTVGATAGHFPAALQKEPLINSISQLERTEAQSDFERRKAKILAHPFFVKLTAEADRIEVYPAKSD